MFGDQPRRTRETSDDPVSRPGGPGGTLRPGAAGSAFAGMTAGAFPGLLPGSAPLSPPDPLEQLERLALLHERGALTDDEFLAQKTRLLGEL